MKIESWHVAFAHVALAYALRGPACAYIGAHIVVQPFARQPHDHRHGHAGNPLAPQRARQVQQPELVAHLHEIGALRGENPAQRTVVRPRVSVR